MRRDEPEPLGHDEAVIACIGLSLREMQPQLAFRVETVEIGVVGWP